MSDLKRRLSALAHQLGVCQTHGAPLSCRTCEPPKPLPEPLSAMLERLNNAIVARVGAEGVRAIMLRVPPPAQRPCSRCCRDHRRCRDCSVEYAQAVYGAIGFTTEEQAMVDAIRAECRAQAAKRS
jgi:hypothetical protein